MGKLTQRIVLLAVLACAPAAAIAQDQPDGQNQGRRGPGQRGPRDRGGQDRRGRDGRRGGPDRRQPPSPEQMLDWQMRMFTDTYDLTNDQQAEVREKLARLYKQDEAGREQRRQQMEEIGGQMRDLWRNRQDGRPVDEAKMRELREQMRKVWESSPLNWEKVTQEVESLLPAEQVEKGRRTREDRMAQMRERFAQNQGRRDNNDGQFRFSGPRDSWESYVDSFIRRYGLDDAQTATARSILQDCVNRRNQLREKQREELTKINEIEDRQERMTKYQELQKPISELFEELRTRLDQIPTSDQRLRAGPPPTTSAPATAPASRDRGTRGPRSRTDAGQPSRADRRQ